MVSITVTVGVNERQALEYRYDLSECHSSSASLLEGRGRLVQEMVTHLASRNNVHSDSELREAEGQLSHSPASLLGPDISTGARGGRLQKRPLGQQGCLRNSFTASPAN